MHRAVPLAQGDDDGVQKPNVELLAQGGEDGAHQQRAEQPLRHGAHGVNKVTLCREHDVLPLQKCFDFFHISPHKGGRPRKSRYDYSYFSADVNRCELPLFIRGKKVYNYTVVKKPEREGYHALYPQGDHAGRVSHVPAPAQVQNVPAQRAAHRRPAPRDGGV